MFRKLTNRISAAASSVFGAEDPNVERLVSMGFDATSASNALRATNGNVEEAAELLLGGNTIPTVQQPVATIQEEDDATLQRVMQESLQLEQQRQAAQPKVVRQPNRTAAMNKAAEAAARRAEAATAKNKPINGRPSNNKTAEISYTPTTLNGINNMTAGLAVTHPKVKLIPKLQDKSKEEQLIRCADRLKTYPQAVDTLYRALVAVQENPDNAKFRSIDKSTPGFQRTLANAAGAEDMLRAMNFRSDFGQCLVLDRHMVDPALLYLGISALEQTKLTPEYKQEKAKIEFAKTIREIEQLANSSEAEAVGRAALMAKCPSEPAEGRGAFMQIVLANETIRRRFDGDDTLMDVLNWLGGHGTVIPEKIMSREWSLVDLNRYPVIPIDCQVNKHNTLQFIGCWPSGRMEVVPSTEEWQRGPLADTKPGSSRGLGSAPSDVVY